LKKLLIFCLGCCLAGSVQAQSETTQPKAAQIASEMCSCFNTFLADYHPLMQQMFKDMAEMGQDKAMENFAEKFTQLPLGEQQRILTDSQRMKEKSMDDVPCMRDLKKKYADVESDKSVQDQVRTELGKLQECAFLAKVLEQQKAKKDSVGQ